MLRFKQFLVEQEFLVEKTIFQTNFDGSGRTLIRGSTKNAISNYEPFAKAFGFSDEQTFVHIGYNGSVGSVQVDSANIVIGNNEQFYDFKTKSTSISSGKRYVSKIQVSDSDDVIVIASGSTGLAIFVAGAGGVKWSEATLETAGAIGLYIDAKSDLKKLQPDKKTAQKIMDVLDLGMDWKNIAKEMIYKKLENFVNDEKGGISTGDMEILLSLVNGMSQFRKTWLGKMGITGDLYFVHSRIPDYYSIEDKAVFDSTKDNTTDLVVMDKPVSEFISIITNENNRLTGVEDKGKTFGYCIASDSNGNELARWAQLSMKKSAGGAQLGKVTTFMKNKYKLGDFSNVFTSMVNEGILDTIKNGIKFAKHLFKSLVTKLKSLTDFLRKKTRTDVVRLRKDQMAAWKMWTKRFKLDKPLREAKVDVNYRLINLTDSEKRNIIQTLNSRLESVYELANSAEWASMGDWVKLSTSDFNKWKADTPSKLLSNFCALTALEKMLSKDNEKIRTLEEVTKEIANIYGDMFFGKTSLPLWKVYGTSDDSHHSEYLGKYEDFMTSKSQSLKQIIRESDLTSGLVLLGITASKQPTGYYNIQSAMLWNLAPDKKKPEIIEKKWIVSRMGTNHGGVTANWVFEGISEIGERLFTKNYVPKR